MICCEQKQEYFDFFERLTGVRFPENDRICFASVCSSGNILGVVMFSNFTSTRCELSAVAVSPRFLTRKLFGVCAKYAFITARKERITAIVANDNDRSLQIAKRLGWTEEGVLKSWYGKKDAIILRMLKNECRFLRKNNG
jgi:RimJ/RimL family protein N-acetyltransferase